MIFFLMTEAMFFAGLISAFLVLRGESLIWPPLDQPRLPLVATGINTIVLLASAPTMIGAWRMNRSRRPGLRNRYLLLTLLFGVTFLAIQGFEWARLIRYGLTTSSSIYGGTFYLLIGAHAAHVLIALLILAVVSLKAARGGYPPRVDAGLTMALMYWVFVVMVWPVLYALVYF
jgi:heme/copper-type cytochrome/quinol oxidase subunit 3